MTLILSLPSKTFLAGEYAVLAGGPALVLNTRPRFELRVQRGSGEIRGLPPEAPAWKWIEARRPLLEKFSLDFHDPHGGQGGFGASGAQFILFHCLTTFLQRSFERMLAGPDLRDIWNDYQVLSGGRGSGADILALIAGRVAVVDVSAQEASTRDWPYPELGFSVIRTHRKVATHEHLETLERQSLSILVRPAQKCKEAFGSAPAEVFVSQLKNFAATLRELDLQTSSTLNLVDRLQGEDWCLLAKGCGALGADTVLVLYPIETHEQAQAYLRKQSLSVVAFHADINPGLDIKWSWSPCH
ncbi:MAG: hypothetical protein AB7G93_14580 [Bdellovibrionales bacterium]